MTRKTRKQHSKKSKKRDSITIPELRRSFEHIEQFVDDKIHSKESKDKIVKELQEEWYFIFTKELSKKSAQEFVEQRMKNCKSSRKYRTLRRKGGGSLGGAPLDYSTRAGMYLAPNSTPTALGHLPLSGGRDSLFGSYVKYVDKGFTNPQPGQGYDPVKGQSPWPTVQAGMGTNVFKGGRRKIRKGGANVGSFLSEVFGGHLVPGSSPPTVLKDIQDMSMGKTVGSSPDVIQTPVPQYFGPNYPKVIKLI